MYQIRLSLGLRHRPRWRSSQRSRGLLSCIYGGPVCKERGERKKKGKGRGRREEGLSEKGGKVTGYGGRKGKKKEGRKEGL